MQASHVFSIDVSDTDTLTRERPPSGTTKIEQSRSWTLAARFDPRAALSGRVNVLCFSLLLDQQALETLARLVASLLCRVQDRDSRLNLLLLNCSARKEQWRQESHCSCWCWCCHWC